MLKVEDSGVNMPCEKTLLHLFFFSLNLGGLGGEESEKGGNSFDAAPDGFAVNK